MFLKLLETKRKSHMNKQYTDLKPSGSRHGIMYGLAKVNKAAIHDL